MRFDFDLNQVAGPTQPAKRNVFPILGSDSFTRRIFGATAQHCCESLRPMQVRESLL